MPPRRGQPMPDTVRLVMLRRAEDALRTARAHQQVRIKAMREGRAIIKNLEAQVKRLGNPSTRYE